MRVALLGREEQPMTEAEVRVLIDMEPVLRKLKLSLYCPRCHARGNPDGIEAKNHPSDATWSLTCGCMARTFQRARETTTVS